jgi:ElaB/YqjD/DUF883 family membrane-anchored ribosome-binding protein
VNDLSRLSIKEIIMETNETLPPQSGAEERHTLAQGVQRATDGAHEAIRTASDAARPAVDRLASRADAAVDRVSGVATPIAESLDTKGDQLLVLQSELSETARVYLRDHPLASLGIAMAAGYALSRLMSRR